MTQTIVGSLMATLIPDDVPNFYSCVADTYILSVVSLAPSHPHFIATAAFDGAVQITDIRSPESDTTLALRQRGML